MKTLVNTDLVHEIRERGFGVVPDVVPADHVSPLREMLHRFVMEDLSRWQGQNYVDKWMVHNLMARELRFAQVLEYERMQAYLAEFLGDTCIVYAYTSSSMPPHGSNYSHRIHVDCPRVIPGYVTNMGVMLALDDFSADNGATWFLPRSQWRETAPTEEEFRTHAERVFPKAGDMVLFNARTWHLGGNNRTAKARHALTLNVCRSYMRQRFDYPRLVPKEILDQLGPVGKRFLGFNVRMPTSLEEYYVPEERRLYKANQG